MSAGTIPVGAVLDAITVEGVTPADLAQRLGVKTEYVTRTLGLRSRAGGQPQRHVTAMTAERYLTAAGAVVACERLLGIPVARCTECGFELLKRVPSGKCRFCEMGMAA
jgi:hypothetical protein